MATEKGDNELFSVARKVTILLISFKLPQPQANRAVPPSLFRLSACQAQNTVVETQFFPSNPEAIENCSGQNV